MEARTIFIALSLKHKGDWRAIMQELQTGKPNISKEIADKALKQKCITFMDKQYPECLKSATGYPPFVLYYKGDITLLNNDLYNKRIAVVGSRHNRVYAPWEVRDIVGPISKTHTIVTGGAIGPQTQALEAALANGQKPIVVLMSSFAQCYPPVNEPLFKKIVKRGGLILTEYPDGTETRPGMALERLRIMIGLCPKLLVVEAERNSGAIAAVAHANALSRDIFVLPTKVDNPLANNELIQVDGIIYTGPEDLDI